MPALALGSLAAALGWIVTDVSCNQTEGGSCVGWGIAIATVAFIGVTVGVALVLVLVYKSLAEWREGSDRRL